MLLVFLNYICKNYCYLKEIPFVFFELLILLSYWGRGKREEEEGGGKWWRIKYGNMNLHQHGKRCVNSARKLYPNPPLDEIPSLDVSKHVAGH